MRSLVLLAVISGVALAEPADPRIWGAVTGPAPGPAESIGGYSAGCVRGAVRLPLVGPGFRVHRPERGRFWGHPSLVGFLEALGAQAKKAGLPTVFVGDLGQPRGGPAPTGHASHQTGLDVDVAYAPPGAHGLASMVAGRQVTRAFSAGVRHLLALAAADPRVERIFVNPLLKRALCAEPTRPGWLRKLRPWWGHADHFHVRLACPEGDRACTSQAPLPPGDGCAELAWWLKPAASADRKKAHGTYKAKVGAAAELPDACHAVLIAPPAPGSPEARTAVAGGSAGGKPGPTSTAQ